jgi:hypothetical protein
MSSQRRLSLLHRRRRDLPRRRRHAAAGHGDRDRPPVQRPRRRQGPLAAVEIDSVGRRTGNVRPRGSLRAGDLSELLKTTPEYLTPPQSGTSWSRSFLEAVLPLPERGVRVRGRRHLPRDPGRRDGGASRRGGATRRVSAPLVLPVDRAGLRGAGRAGLRRYDVAIDALERHCRRVGLPADPEGWRRRSWVHRLRAVAAEIDALIDSDVAGCPLPMDARASSERRMTIEFRPSREPRTAGRRMLLCMDSGMSRVKESADLGAGRGLSRQRDTAALGSR